MLNVLADTRWIGRHGIGRFAREVLRRLPGCRPVTIRHGPPHPLDPLLLWREVRRERPEVFFSPGFCPPLRCPVPVVFTIHDLMHVEFPGETSAARRAFYRFGVLPAARRAYRVLTVSHHSRARILEWSGLPEDRVTVVPNGVGEPFGPDGPVERPGWPYVLYVGNHKPHKNLPRLLEAFARLHETFDDGLRLVIPGRRVPETEESVGAMGLADRVVFPGPLPDDALAAWYRGAACLACPSLYEGFGLPPLEAMACGTPVVASAATSLPEVVGDAAAVVDPHCAESIAQGLRKAIEDTALRNQLREKGLCRARQFTWDRTAQGVRDVLEQAARPR